MSEPSDFPDSFEPDQHIPPKESFDPAEHIDHPAEVYAGEYVDLRGERGHDPLVDEKAESFSQDYAQSYVPSQSGGIYLASPVAGIGLALIAGILFVGSAYGISMVSGQQPPAPAEAPAAPTAVVTAPVVDDPKVLATRVDAIKADVDGMTKKLDDVQKQMAAMPKPEPAPDLKPLDAKIDAIAKRIDAAPMGLDEKLSKATAGQANLLAKLDAITAQTGKFEKALAAEKANVSALQAKVKALSEATSVPAATVASTAPAANTDADFTKAADLFKKSQFAAAKDLFAKLQEGSPNDARVWYYSAMANGFATNLWTGETERLVSKGMELEKAGTPDLAKINATFTDLAASAKGWLDSYRSRIIR